MTTYVDPSQVVPPGYVDPSQVVPPRQASVPPRQAAPPPILGQQPQPGWFPGQVMTQPVDPRLVEQTAGALRGGLADFAFGPAQMVAGLADAGNEAARRLGMSGANDARMGQAVSTARNILAGRPGTQAGPATGLVQGLATAPMGGPLRSVVQGLGLGAGLATPEESPLIEGGKGAAVTGGMNLLGGMVGKTVAGSQAEQRLMDIARKHGIRLRYGAASNVPQVKEMEARSERSILLGFGRGNLAFKQREAVEDDMSRAVWRKIGMNFDEFTPTNLNAASEAIGKKLQAPFAKGDIPFKGTRLQMAVDHAVRVTDDMTRPQFVMDAASLIDKKILAGKISSSELNVVMDDLRGLANKAYDDNNKVAGDAINNLIKSVKTHVISQIPSETGKEAYKKALTQYANLKVVEDAFVKSAESARGNLDFSKLKAAIERNMPGGYTRARADLADLAELGQAIKTGRSLPEGIKGTLTDPLVYGAFNNPLSMYLRERNPVNAATAQALLKAAGVQSGTE